VPIPSCGSHSLAGHLTRVRCIRSLGRCKTASSGTRPRLPRSASAARSRSALAPALLLGLGLPRVVVPVWGSIRWLKWRSDGSNGIHPDEGVPQSPARQPRRLSCYSRGAQERREGRRGPDVGCAAPTPEPDRRTRRWWEWLQGRAAHNSISASSVSPAAMRTAASASCGTSRNRVRTYAAQPAAQARLRAAV
jgi:hypothetical protein